MNNGRCVGCCLIVVVDTHEEPILTVRNPAADSPLHDHGEPHPPLPAAFSSYSLSLSLSPLSAVN